MAEAHQYYDSWLRKILDDMGFKQTADPKYFIKWKGKEFFKLPLYVDDMSVQWRGRKLRDWVLKTLQSYGIKIKVSPFDRALGINIRYNFEEGWIAMNCRDAKERLVELAGLKHCKPKSTPLPPGTVLNKNLDENVMKFPQRRRI